jgi:hypothetical protein
MGMYSQTTGTICAIKGRMTYRFHLLFVSPIIHLPRCCISPYDPLMIASRGAVALSLLFTYPLPFVGLRDGALDVLNVSPEDRTETLQTAMTVGLLSVVSIAAYYINDLALLLSVGGGTFSTAVAAVFPTIMYTAAAKRFASGNETHATQVKIAQALMVVCVGIGGTGVYFSLCC